MKVAVNQHVDFFIWIFAKTSNMIEHFHAVWGTKKRFPFLKKDKKDLIIEHIKQTAKKYAIHIHAIDGGEDHMHCAFDLPENQNIEKVMMYFKGESSFWINRNKLFPIKFQWSRRYYAEKIHPSVLPKIIKYIENQEEHHRKMSFDEKWEAVRKVNSILPLRGSEVGGDFYTTG